MKTPLTRTLFCILLVASLAGCNFPDAFVPDTDTPTPVPPTATLPPPTDTPVPPTDTPPPTLTNTLPPPPPTLQPTRRPTDTPAPTATEVFPLPRAKFVGTFDNGKIAFRTNENGKGIAIKEVVLSKANCNNGREVSTRYDFTSPVYFPIEYGRYTITMETVTINGYFYHPPTVTAGVVTIYVKSGRLNCTVGPIDFTAEIQ